MFFFDCVCGGWIVGFAAFKANGAHLPACREDEDGVDTDASREAGW